MSTDREDEVELSPHEVAAYLEDLKSDLTGDAEASVDASDDDRRRHHPPPDGPVRVKEQMNDEADGDEWTIVIQWKGARASDTVIDFDAASGADADADTR